MGNQQLLLIVVSVVILGIAVAVGATLFQDQAASTNRDELVNDLVNYGAQAQAYYKRPRVFGGGENSFNGLTMARITSRSSNLNGAYSLLSDPVGGNPNHVSIVGVGTEIGADGANKVKVVMLVYADSMQVDETDMN